MDQPIVFLHGYGATERAFDAWRSALANLGFERHHVIAYQTHSNEVDLDDLGEAVERAIQLDSTLSGSGVVHVVVHSTGMLVLQAWLKQHPNRLSQLGWVICLAPATAGSPLAHKGRGMLAALVNGRVDTPNDRLEGGDRLLAALELGSPDTWRFATEGPNLPPERLLVFTGLRAYDFPRGLLHEPGSDGVVRHSGAHPITTRIDVDLTRDAPSPRVRRIRNYGEPLPTIFSAEHHHGSILTRPPRRAVDLVRRALHGKPMKDLRRRMERLTRSAAAHLEQRGETDHRWTQIVMRVESERGSPVDDYYLDLLVHDGTKGEGAWASFALTHPSMALRVHVNRTDPSIRTFFLDLGSARHVPQRLAIRIAARSQSSFIGYRGFNENLCLEQPSSESIPGVWTATVDLSPILRPGAPNTIRPFAPGATTYVRVRIDREPLPFDGSPHLAALVRNDPRT